MVRKAAGGKERRGVLFIQGRALCSREVHWVCLNHLLTFADSRMIVIGIYTKTGGKNSKYSWTQGITNISSAATIHIQLFRHIFRNRYSEKHNQPIPGMRRFEIIAPWQFLCTASAPTFSHSGEVILTPCDRTTVETLTCSVLSIGVCMAEFTGKRGRKTVEEGEDGDDADADE